VQENLPREVQGFAQALLRTLKKANLMKQELCFFARKEVHLKLLEIICFEEDCSIELLKERLPVRPE